MTTTTTPNDIRPDPRCLGVPVEHGRPGLMDMAPTTTPMDVRPDPELLGVPLDLGREELRPLMLRYSSEQTRAAGCMFRRPAVIVTRAGMTEEPLKKALEDNGWFVKSCLGPGRVRCPILRGEPCPLRESVDVAVVYVDPKLTYTGTGLLPRLRCAADSSSPAVVALQGRAVGPHYGRSDATVGALSGTKTILDTIDTVLSTDVR